MFPSSVTRTTSMNTWFFFRKSVYLELKVTRTVYPTGNVEKRGYEGLYYERRIFADVPQRRCNFQQAQNASSGV